MRPTRTPTMGASGVPSTTAALFAAARSAAAMTSLTLVPRPVATL